jgi:hypothetical protein
MCVWCTAFVIERQKKNFFLYRILWTDKATSIMSGANSTTYINDKWRILKPFDALHLIYLALTFGPES